MKALWLALEDRSYGWALALTVGLSAPLSFWLYRRFASRHE